MSLSRFKQALSASLFMGAVVGLSACTTTQRIERTNYVVFFDSQSADLSPAGEAVVEEAARMIKKTHQNYVRVAGSAGHLGDDAQLKQLADQRAQSVLTALEKNGVKEKTLHIIPFAPDESEDSRIALRRVDIQLGQD